MVVRSGAGQGEVDAELVVPVVAPPAVGLLLLQLLPQARDGVLEAANVLTYYLHYFFQAVAVTLGERNSFWPI